MDPKDPKEILRIWIDALQRLDIDALMGCYADDAVNFQVAAGEPAVGKELIRVDFEAFFAAFPDLYANVENLIGEGDWAAWEWLGGGTWTGEFLGNEATGKSYELRGCGFFHFRDGKIIYQRGYWDKHTWFSQIGLPIE